MDKVIFFVNTAHDDITTAINAFEYGDIVNVDSIAIDSAIVSLESVIQELKLKVEHGRDSII